MVYLRLVLGVSALLLAALPTARAELNLSPQIDSFDQEGIKMTQLAFNTGGTREATYQPPADWKYSGTKDSLDLLPEGTAQAKATVTKWPASPELSLEAGGQKALTARFSALLPEGSEQVKVQAEASNPLQIDGQQTYLVELTYTYYGTKFACYSLVLDHKREPLFFRLICRESDYEKLKTAFQRSLYTWQNL